MILKFAWKQERPQIVKTILRKTNKTGLEVLHSLIQTIPQSYSNQNSVVLVKKRNKKPDRPHMYSISVTKEARVCNGGNTVSLVNSFRKIGQPHMKEAKWTMFPCHIQRLAQNGLNTSM